MSRYSEFTLYKCEHGLWVYRASGSLILPRSVTVGEHLAVTTPGEVIGWTTGKIKAILEDTEVSCDFMTERGTLYRLAKQHLRVSEEGISYL